VVIGAGPAGLMAAETLAQAGVQVDPCDAAGSGAVLAPLTARVLQVMVTPGQRVQAGERLLVLEAMKMEHTLTAPFTGVVRELLAQAGGQALKGALLLQIEAAA
jgi:geranyl-CoA carboxylase alpha subunit